MGTIDQFDVPVRYSHNASGRKIFVAYKICLFSPRLDASQNPSICNTLHILAQVQLARLAAWFNANIYAYWSRNPRFDSLVYREVFLYSKVMQP